jgi:hypothetical protein
MPITILGITLGGENARIKEAANAYAIKFPISGDINALRQNLGRAIIELGDLKGSTYESAADKRTQQRNITALTTQTINLQNAINDANMYMGSATNNFTMKLPKFNLKSPYATNGSANTTNIPPVNNTNTTISGNRPTKASELFSETQQQNNNQVVDNTDGGQPQGAVGNYPPPQGVQGINYGKWLGIGALVAGVGTLGYVFLKKKK